MTKSDPLNAFIDYGNITREGKPGGPLSGLTFGLKDLFDLAHVPTGAGSPDWLRSHPVPTKDSAVATLLLNAGAKLVGKTHTDEMAWSLNGENAHYGTPINAAAPGRIPGGSSSGSAAAVGGGLVDFAIGSDTGGSIRAPASYCGIYGLRPTHGRIDISGAVALAESYDTVGWFARDPDVFARVGKVLLGSSAPGKRPQKLLIAEDLFDKAGASVTNALQPALATLKSLFSSVDNVTIGGDALPEWRNAFRILQGADAWAYHRAWVLRVQPNFGPGVRERFQAASQFTTDEIAAAQAIRNEVRKRMEHLLPPDTILALPSTPGIAPLCNLPEADTNAYRARALEILCTAGHAGLPQLSMPLAMLDQCPLGLSILGGRGQDERLTDIILEPKLARKTV